MSHKFAVFDIDGTLIRWQLYHALVDKLAKHGQISQAGLSKIKQARMHWKRRETNDGFKEYERVVVKQYEKALLSIKASEFDVVVGEVVDEYKDQTHVYTRDLLKTLKKQGYLLFAISGSHKELVDRLANHHGFDDLLATEYTRKKDRFTGQKIFPTHDKKSALDQLVNKHGCSYKDSYGVGDSASDAPMLEVVDNPIAFNPDGNLYRIATKNGWKIVIERKNVVYELKPNSNTYQLER